MEIIIFFLLAMLLFMAILLLWVTTSYKKRRTLDRAHDVYIIRKLFNRVADLEGNLLEVPELIEPMVKDDIHKQVYNQEKEFLDEAKKYYF